MSKLNSTPFSDPRFVLYSLMLLFTFNYPGHNRLQTVTLNPGLVQSYDLPNIPLAPYPLSDQTPPPPVTATSYLVQDITSKVILAERRPDTTLPPASITKLMTALVSLDAWPDPETILTVNNQDPAIGQSVGLAPGESLTVGSLLRALLIHSGNDAALVLANNYEGGYPTFVQEMNVRARELGLSQTVYKNPSGIDQYGHTTTARDIATLAALTLTDPVIQNIVNLTEAEISDTTGTITHDLRSTDELLGVLPGLLGGKTGYTASAGECFVALVEREGRGIITVVLGSSDRFADTTRLVEWVFDHHTWIQPDASL